MRKVMIPPYLETDENDYVRVVVDPTTDCEDPLDYVSHDVGRLPDLDFERIPTSLRLEAVKMIENFEPGESLRADDNRNYYDALRFERW